MVISNLCGLQPVLSGHFSPCGTQDFIEYLRQKHPSMRFKDLCFEEGGYSRSIVLYMLQEDFDGEEVKKMRRDTTGGACDTHVIRGGE